MNYSFTGVAYLTLFLALGFLTYRFFQYWKREKDLVSKLLLSFIALFALFAFIKTIGGLFFANNQTFLIGTINAGALIQALAFAVITYFVIYLKFPKISPWWGFIPILILGLLAAVLTITTPSYPFLEESGAINWGFSHGASSLLRFFLFFVTFFPGVFIFFQQFKTSKDPYTKRKSLGLFLSLIFALLVTLLDFLLVNFLKVDPIWRDVSSIVISMTLFITLLLALPRLPSKSSYYYIKTSNK
jgi:hypothetical protein